jgi:hypothetical protein
LNANLPANNGTFTIQHVQLTAGQYSLKAEIVNSPTVVHIISITVNPPVIGVSDGDDAGLVEYRTPEEIRPDGPHGRKKDGVKAK